MAQYINNEEFRTLVRLEAALMCHQIGGDFKPMKAKYRNKLVKYELYQAWDKQTIIVVNASEGKAHALRTIVECLDELYNAEFKRFEKHSKLNSLEGVL